MLTTVATIFVNLLQIYFLIGILFAILFAFRGVQHIDDTAVDATFGFRLIIIPGAAALWPLLALRWIRKAGRPPTEHNAHRAVATGSSGEERE